MKKAKMVSLFFPIRSPASVATVCCVKGVLCV